MLSVKMIGRLQCLKQIPSVSVASRACLSAASSSSHGDSKAVTKTDEFTDAKTHTGQVWGFRYQIFDLMMLIVLLLQEFDKDDYRLSRYVNNLQKKVCFCFDFTEFMSISKIHLSNLGEPSLRHRPDRRDPTDPGQGPLRVLQRRWWSPRPPKCLHQPRPAGQPLLWLLWPPFLPGT